MPHLTTEELKKLREDITKGPWEFVADYMVRYRGSEPTSFVAGPENTIIYADDEVVVNDDQMEESDAKAIALLPDLLSELIALREKMEGLREKVEAMMNLCWCEFCDGGSDIHNHEHFIQKEDVLTIIDTEI